ncbi:hypothetical protein HK103_007045 [Boothiomyces macroporosus]|uniref:Arylamine N-acetyltransferase n=1 Tax=Boothiomyces macroporosus TaxID=261099 RepID=A0AAD5UD13_9FUNG|nr:hypothetical protein HK103_007045 [Boothiomyces macroporosus]
MTLAVQDLDAYFVKIGYSGPREPTLETLSQIQTRHTLSIPFENASVFTGHGYSITPDVLKRDIIYGAAPGTCVRQNSLVMSALKTIGFIVEPVLARVQWNIPPGVVTGLLHCALKITLPEGNYLVDVAFGSTTAVVPIKMVDGLVQKTPHDLRRIVYFADGSFEHQIAFTSNPDNFKPLYKVNPLRVEQSDLEVTAYYAATSPSLFFANNLVASRVTEKSRITLENWVLSTRHLDGSKEKRVLKDKDEILHVLDTVFGIPWPKLTPVNCPGLENPPDLEKSFIFG